MVLTPSNMRELGQPAPDFTLPDTEGNTVQLADFAAVKGFLVAFWCNHCPYVKHIRQGFVQFANDYAEADFAIVAISANDVQTHPQDHPDRMRDEASEHGFIFPYLYDESQDVAKAYGAACTPDFFLYDANRCLVYRGQFDASRPGNDIPVNGANLRAAVDALLADRPIPAEQRPSIGCNIKWKPGNAPA